MGVCDLCGKESNLIFLCSKCGNRYCREHRNPEYHECISIKEISEEVQEEIYIEPEEIKQELDISDFEESQIEVLVEDIPIEDEPESSQILEGEIGIQVSQVEEFQVDEKQETIVEEPLKEYSLEENKKEKRFVGTRFLPLKLSSISLNKGQIVLLSISFVFGILLTSVAGTLFSSPSTEVDTLKQRYDTLYLHFVNLSSLIQDLQIEIDEKSDELLLVNQLFEEKKTEYDSIREELNRLEMELSYQNSNYSFLYDFWDKVILNQGEIEIPTLAQIETWVSEDSTDNLILNEDLRTEHLSLLLSLKAREMNWKIGIVEISGNYTSDNVSKKSFNLIITEEGLVYIDPKNDNVWWNEQYEEITIDKNWEINDQKVMVKEITYILDY
jgi:hypothetical protein